MRPGELPHLAGTMRRLTSRRIREQTFRALRCPDGHKLKVQPLAVTATALPCTYKLPPSGAVECEGAAYYVTRPDGRIWGIEATRGELLYIHAHRLDTEAALAFLEVAPELLDAA